ncbi:Fanconi anemia group M protein [Trichogramma pretiosum]|uniref:Fanconi anemia group M protein n=1 Tax=Trichogramma pretiosum TaxID=7493 RepID=UPI0006C945DE|nr:Fanconi anemia group M protein [Trichogramma pretiosum]XP_023317195.1 Fanconi anemia group M protein [Trichogramma pretiosum]
MAQREAQASTSSTSQNQFFSSDPATSGFDLSSGLKWIYPENYPRREYQFNIVQTALFNNTLVCLPTGLGKTFIAAVVMYNFWRWYPSGRVVFMAPTKPLVAQQIEACHDIMGIPSEESIELTGTVNPNKRKQAWIEKRVIFATPQTFQKDLQNELVPFESIKCIVIDEAHRALGKHAYCEIVRLLSTKSKYFRVLALSATPGSKVDHVREVIQNLLISELELRDDSSSDIIPYTNEKSVERVVVSLGRDLDQIKEKYIQVMDPHVRILTKAHLLQGNTGNISKGRIFMLMKQYESRPQKLPNHGTIMKTLNVLLTMYHAYELLIKHGLRAFYHFYNNHSDKFWFNSETNLRALLEEVKSYIGDFPIVNIEPNHPIPEIPENLVFGHKKFMKLREILVEHFESYARQNKSTRAIVFVEYRDIVNEVFVLLLLTRPLIRPQMLVGQAGQKQKQQMEALEDFRSNKVNVLISTSVGEEGLDVGEVDLIICFDVSSSTPTRLVQKMGRTGRKRSGRVIILLTEGKEELTLQQAMSKKDSLNSKVLESSNISSSLYQSSPRMIPPNLTPQCLPMFIKPLPKTPKASKGTKKAKAPVEKKPRKKKTIEPDIVEPTSAELIEITEPTEATELPKSKPKKSRKNQPSMMQFLNPDLRSTGNTLPSYKKLPSYGFDDDSGILSEEFQVESNIIRENPYAIIRPHEVKLLTSDSDALEFLTLCTMKQSDKNSNFDNFFNFDLSYFPQHSQINIFDDFFVPNVTNLENWIKNLTMCEVISEMDQDNSIRETFKTFENETYNHSKISSFLESNKTDFIECPESKYISKNPANLESQYYEEIMEVESKYTKNHKKSDSIPTEIADSDFIDDFYEKKMGTASSNGSNTKGHSLNHIGSDFFDADFNSFEIKHHGLDSTKSKEQCVKNSTSQDSIRTPANVNVDFENLLDECTESENSQVPDSPCPVQSQNIYDELLEADSSGDEDMFVTVIDKEKKEDKTLTESPKRLSLKPSASISPLKESDRTITESPKRLSLKRSASISPLRESKKLKTEQLETSPMISSMNSNSNVNDVKRPIFHDNGMDSDEDLFGDIEFETQFTFKVIKNSTMLDKNNKSIMHQSLEAIRENSEASVIERSVALGNLSILEGSPSASQDNNNKSEHEQTLTEIKAEIKDEPMSWNDKTGDVEKEKLNVKRQMSQIKEESDIVQNMEHDSLEEVMVVSDSDDELKKGSELMAKCVNATEKVQNNSEKKNNNDNAGEIHISDWEDDFDYHPVEEKSTTSNFFSKPSSSSKQSSCDTKSTKKNPNNTSFKSCSQETSSSGWITVEKIKPSKKTLALKNTNFPHRRQKLPSGSSKSDEENSSQFIFRIPGSPRKPNPTVLSLHQMKARSTLNLTNLQRNVSEAPKIDQDGFKMPEVKKLPQSVTNVKSTLQNRMEKENELPTWKKKKLNHSPACISPRFRRYHSDNDLTERKYRKKSRARKRILNDFIEDEAEISSDMDTSEGSEGEDDDLEDFVSYTQEVPDKVDMQAHYLRTINEDLVKNDGFVFRKPSNHVPDHEVFSQPMQSQMNDTYMNDSFCVAEATQYVEEVDEDLSLLADLELNLEKKRRTRSKKKSDKFKDFENQRRKKNKFVVVHSSDSSSDNNHETSSSEDETEAMRKQVLEESMLMKQSKN